MKNLYLFYVTLLIPKVRFISQFLISKVFCCIYFTSLSFLKIAMTKQSFLSSFEEAASKVRLTYHKIRCLYVANFLLVQRLSRYDDLYSLLSGLMRITIRIYEFPEEVGLQLKYFLSSWFSKGARYIIEWIPIGLSFPRFLR